MARELYQTEGLILNSWPQGESSLVFTIFTRDLGLVKALAQAVREGRSKLRYQLQTGNLVNLDLVRGRDLWRITGASGTRCVLPPHISAAAAANLIGLIKRLAPWEEPQTGLFQDLLASFNFFGREEEADLEVLLALRTLHYFGYFDPAPDFIAFTADGQLSTTLIRQFAPRRQQAIQLINQALTMSHL